MPYRRLVVAAVLAGVLGLLAGRAGGAAARAATFEKIADGFDAPTYVTSAPGDPSTLYVVEQPGTIELVRDGAAAGRFLDIRSRVRSGGEQGLLSLAFHPAYAQNGLFYVNYTDRSGDTRVVQMKAANGSADPSTARTVLYVKQPYANHNGGQLQFDRAGYLYVGMGDGGSGGDPENRAQNLRSRLGKLLRWKPGASGPWRIVAYGLRNPWRFSFDRELGHLWIGDVGQNAWEEIDYRNAARIGRLANYGWPRFEGRAVFGSRKPLVRRGDLIRPVLVYSHDEGCSVTGGYVYRGAAVPAAQGRYFYGDYCSGTVWSFAAGAGRLSAPQVEGRIDSLSSFGEDASGELYATSSDGSLYRLAA